jgi:ABC-type amino acid transport substrate-binding protein
MACALSLNMMKNLLNAMKIRRVNAALYSLEKSGELDKPCATWLGPNTE